MIEYSLKEKMIGYWIDGKPLYEKTVECGALPNATAKNVAHGISNIDTIIKLDAFGYRSSDGVIIPIPLATHTGENQINVYASRTFIEIYTANDRSSYSESYVTLRYTKTND